MPHRAGRKAGPTRPPRPRRDGAGAETEQPIFAHQPGRSVRAPDRAALGPLWAGRAVAVTGATGFVGHHVVAALVNSGARVTALVRSGSRRAHLMELGVRCVEAALDDRDALARAVGGCEFLF